MMMAHLRRKAYNRILILKGPSGAQDARQRLAGCLAQVKEQPVPTLQIDCAEGGYDAEQAVKAFRKYRAAHGLPRAVFALNDAMALAVLKECRYRDIAVPEEVAVAGFDGIQCAAYMGLTTIQTPMTELGRTAVQKLVEYIENTHHKPERIRLPGRLIVRETT
jgi:DNA-binding LacI/PurR family transcriptional regulator